MPAKLAKLRMELLLFKLYIGLFLKGKIENMGDSVTLRNQENSKHLNGEKI